LAEQNPQVALHQDSGLAGTGAGGNDQITLQIERLLLLLGELHLSVGIIHQKKYNGFECEIQLKELAFIRFQNVVDVFIIVVNFSRNPIHKNVILSARP